MENSRESIIRRIRTSIFEGSDSNKYAVNQPSVSIDTDTIVDSYYTYSQLSESVNQCVSSLRSLGLSQSSMVLLVLDVDSHP